MICLQFAVLIETRQQVTLSIVSLVNLRNTRLKLICITHTLLLHMKPHETCFVYSYLVIWNNCNMLCFKFAVIIWTRPQTKQTKRGRTGSGVKPAGWLHGQAEPRSWPSWNDNVRGRARGRYGSARRPWTRRGFRGRGAGGAWRWWLRVNPTRTIYENCFLFFLVFIGDYVLIRHERYTKIVFCFLVVFIFLFF